MNIGTDILYIPRLKKLLDKDSNFINKIYTIKEIELSKLYKNPICFFATRFSAKEAIIKATNGEFDFKQIEILKEKSGKPIPKIINHPEIIIELSLSYDNDYAIAFCTTKKQR